MSISDSLKIFFRPERLKYIKSAFKGGEKSCVFCDGLAAGASYESLLIHESSLSMVFLNKYPYNSGHILVLSKRHTGDLTDLSSEEAQDLHRLLVQAVAVLKSVLNPQALNLGMNMGKESGGGIPGHLHYHIIPRWAGDTNFYPLIAKAKVISTEQEDIYNEIKRGFEKL